MNTSVWIQEIRAVRISWNDTTEHIENPWDKKKHVYTRGRVRASTHTCSYARNNRVISTEYTRRYLYVFKCKIHVDTDAMFGQNNTAERRGTHSIDHIPEQHARVLSYGALRGRKRRHRRHRAATACVVLCELNNVPFDFVRKTRRVKENRRKGENALPRWNGLWWKRGTSYERLQKSMREK